MNNLTQLLWLVPILPLIGFLINGIFRNNLSKNASAFIGSAVIFASFILSCVLFIEVRETGAINIEYFKIVAIEGFSLPLNFKVDELSGIFLLIITGVGLLIHVYSASYMHEEEGKDYAKYFSFLNLFVFSMLLLVMGGNFVVMFAGWEGVGLCSYFVIGYWYKNKAFTNAAKKAFIMNRIGDLGFLLGVFWLLARLGTVSYDEVFTAQSLAKLSNTDITGITLLLFVGATGKSAQIPLFTWLPDAMAGPTPVSALIHAATMVTAGVYMIARSNAIYSLAPVTQNIIAITGLLTALVAAAIAIKQNDIKKVLAYSTVSQLGFMFIALGTGHYVAALFHVITHAFFKALLFLGSGSVIHAMGGEQDIRNMGGLHKHMKITSITFLIGCIAIAGIPGFSGFFSKDEILAGAFGASPLLYGATLFAALLTAFYMFRLYILTFTGKFRGTHDQEHHLHESPILMTLPLIILAVFAIVGGYINVPEALGGKQTLARSLQNIIPLGEHHLSHETEYMLMGLSTILVIASILFACFRFKKYKVETNKTSLGKALAGKLYFDEFYEGKIASTILASARGLNKTVEVKGIDGMVNGVGKFVQYASRQLRWAQSGNVGAYILLMVIGMIILFIIQFFA